MSDTQRELSASDFAKQARSGPVGDFALGPGSEFEGTELNLTASHGRCSGVDFSRCTLSGSSFHDVTFHDCRFRATELDDCRFERCEFFDPEQDTKCDFSFASLRDTVFEKCDLTTSLFVRTRAYGLTLSRCQAQGTEFTEADFSLALPTGHDSDVCHAVFDGCNLSYADFSGTDLTACRLTDNRLVHSVWHNAVLERAQLAGSTLDNIEGKGLVLRGADLRGCRFNNLDPREIDLTDVQVELEQGLVLLHTLGIDVS